MQACRRVDLVHLDRSSSQPLQHMSDSFASRQHFSLSFLLAGFRPGIINICGLRRRGKGQKNFENFHFHLQNFTQIAGRIQVNKSNSSALGVVWELETADLEVNFSERSGKK